MKLVCFLLVAVAAPWVHGGDPGFPSDFKVDVQVHSWFADGVESYTIAYTAKGNGEGNMLYVADTSNGKSDIKLFNFDKDVFVTATSRDETCKQVAGIPDKEKGSLLFPVAFESRGRSKVLRNPDSLFRFDGRKSLNGSATNGIATWVTTTIFKSDKDGRLQCNLQFDWTQNGTTTPLCERRAENGNVCPPVPVEATLNCGDDKLVRYLFSSYTENLDYTIFEPPLGYYCEGKEVRGLPRFPDVFSLRAENILPLSGNKVWNSRLWVDAANKVVATRYRKEDNDVKVISDYTSGFDYEISVLSGRCVPKAMGDRSLTDEIKNELVWGEPVATDNQMSGYHPCRLWKWCAVYAGFLGEGKVQNLYYAADPDVATPRRPVYMETRDSGILQSQRHVFGYTEDVRDWTQFDLYRCFHREDIRVVRITVEGDTDFDGDLISPAHVRESYRDALVKALGISQTLRVTRFYHIPDPSKKGLTAVTFIYPARASKYGVADISSDDAIQRLMKVVAKGEFSFAVKTKLATEVTYKATNVSDVRKANEAAPSRPYDEKSRGYSSGSMAALGFGTLFLGVVVALVAVVVVARYYPKNQFTSSLLQNAA